MKGIIHHGGHGTRLRPLTHTGPKQLLPIANKPMSQYCIESLQEARITEFVKDFKQSTAKASILLCVVDNPSRFGIADVKEGQIIKIIEKPKNPPSNLAVTGIYFLTPTIFDIIERLKLSWRNELEITDALQMLLEENY